jgi:hypothetical protein
LMFWKKEFSNAQTPLAIIGKSNAFILELEVDEHGAGGFRPKKSRYHGQLQREVSMPL